MDIQKVIKQIPKGSISEISKISGVHYASIKRFFDNENSVKERTKFKILKGIAIYLKAINEERKTTFEALESALN